MRSKLHFLKQPLIAFLTPLIVAYKTGHIRSSFTRTSVNKKGDPRPWYSLPAVYFLTQRDFSSAKVLEFGGGYSTVWWSKTAKHVTTFEEDEKWTRKILAMADQNVDAFAVPVGLKGERLRSRILEQIPSSKTSYDVVVVDAMHRQTLIDLAFELCSPEGLIIVDNSEGYDTYEITRSKDWFRVDFIGPANGVSSQHSTSFFFKNTCPYLSSKHPIAWDL